MFLNLTTFLNPMIDNRRFFAPEVVQTSAMDCGPASLKAMLEGYDIPVSYGRLREACQTDVDGTSIDVMEEVALQLGLEAEQHVLPADHLLLTEDAPLPAIVIIRQPNGATHFVILWRRHHRLVQVMDPATGRRWMTHEAFLSQLYVHPLVLTATEWRAWAETDGFLFPLRQRLGELGLTENEIEPLVSEALAEPAWFGLASLDATTRMMTAIIKARGLTRGESVSKIVRHFFTQSLAAQHGNSLANRPAEERDSNTFSASDGNLIPDSFWLVKPYRPAVLLEESNSPGEERVVFHGAVVVQVFGQNVNELKPSTAVDDRLDETPDETPDETSDETLGGVSEVRDEPTRLSPELQAALTESPPQPLRDIWRYLGEDGWLIPSSLVLALLLSTLGVTIEALLFQSVLGLSQLLTSDGQRLGAIAAFFAFLLVFLLLEFPSFGLRQRLSRRFETRLRMDFLAKIPRLSDRYFHSRLTSDMTMRAHELRQLRTLPDLGFQVLNLVFRMSLITGGIILFQPGSALIATAATGIFMALSFIARPILDERDQRVRAHAGAISRFYLDGLLGLIPLRTHNAEKAMLREHENLLVDLAQSQYHFAQMAVWVQAIGTLLYSIFTAWLLFHSVATGSEPLGMLLLLYWALSLPVMGQQLVQWLQQYPALRNRLLRIMEPLNAPDEVDVEAQSETMVSGSCPLDQAVHIEMEQVTVQAAGQTILSDVNLAIQAGEHVGIVGQSGAGKSTLAGLLLGWHRPTIGEVRVDDLPLQGEMLYTLRHHTTWVDPAIQLWNRSLLKNLTYGSENSQSDSAFDQIIEQADLFAILEKLPDGLQASLGEGGGLVSGGEGQRVRLGRAILRRDVRLVILDEPFRGLDREKRRTLLAAARQHWRDATLLCITHDIAETQDFDRVLVIEDGQVIEDGPPAALLNQPASRYQALYKAEQATHRDLWQYAAWERWWLADGQLNQVQVQEESE